MDQATTCRHGDIIHAIRQTAGRGRFNRKWYSPSDRELTFSIVVRDAQLNPQSTTLLGPAAALAIRTMLQDHAIAAEVKWPNDVLSAGSKIAGILAERDLRTETIVVGMGINVNLQEDELSGMSLPYVATSMLARTGQAQDPDAVLQNLLTHLDTTMSAALSGNRAELRQQWERHDALKGCHVRVATPDGIFDGTYAGMTDAGALRLKLPTGQEQILFSGDVAAFQIRNRFNT